MAELFTTLSNLTNAKVDEKLENAVVLNMKTERLICCYLSAMRERGAYRDFGFSSIYDYADERFGFSSRKTRYLVFLGRRLDELPQLREALKEGKIGWCKARLVASRATAEDEVMWLDTALSLSVRELNRRIKDRTDDLASTIQFWMADTQRATWENALEICRRVAGTQLSPGEALELIAGEFLATYAHLLNDDDDEVEDDVVETCLSKDPDDRWQTARDLSREVKRVDAGETAPSESTPTIAPQRPTVWQRPVLAIAASVAITVVALRWTGEHGVPRSRDSGGVHPQPFAGSSARGLSN